MSARVYALSAFLTMAALVAGVSAYGTFNPPAFGHSIMELNWGDPADPVADDVYITGNVNIGSTAPAGGRLDVNGPLVVRTDGATNQQSFFLDDQVYLYVEPEYVTDTNSSIFIGGWDFQGATGARNLVLQPLPFGGKVGIGRSPAGKLDIEGGLAIGGSAVRGTWPGTIARDNLITTVSATDSFSTDLVIAPDGLPFIVAGGDVPGLEARKCVTVDCAISTSVTLDGASTAGSGVQAVIGSDGLPVVAYRGSTGLLTIRHCNDPACTSSSLTTVPSTNVNGLSMIMAPGYPLIIAHTGVLLNAYRCLNVACSTVSSTTLVGSNVGNFLDVVITPTDRQPVVLYYDGTSNIRSIKCTVNCTSVQAGPTAIITGDNSGQYLSATIGKDGLPIVAFYRTPQDELRFSKCQNLDCSTATTADVIDTVSANTGTYVSMTLAPDGSPLITYYDETLGQLRLTKCVDAFCAPAAGYLPTTIDSVGNPGKYNSVAIGADGLPIISYHRQSTKDLTVVRCGSEYCVPFWTRR
ncbi:MAG: hypothetical protein HY369_00425 [Candidatus Aenigmarchaeota archaeon]|nr:hypothetical protein [Candidatus Aenigmarchaeota archaeon]